MKSLHDVQKAFEKKVAENQAKEEAIRANPKLAKTPGVKKRYRTNGFIMLILGLVISFATYMGYQETGRVLIIALATSMVFVGAGFWMMLTGTNPFMGLKKK